MDDTKKTGPRDVFSHLLAIIFLYVSVFSFASIIFSFIDLYFPDLLQNYGPYVKDGLRWPLAVLVVVFPLYVWLTWYLANDVVHNPEKRELKTRKWLLYFTLFATTIAIVIDLISLIFSFLNGELSVHFVLKVLTVLAIAGGIFVYYLWTIRKGTPALTNTKMKIFVYGSIGIVALTIVFGFYVAGSPGTERALRFDQTRISDLSILQSQIVNYWQTKQKLPAVLSDLENDISGFRSPTDPETGVAYEYRITGDKSFELCATFKMEDSSSNQNDYTFPKPIGGAGETWQHGAGRQCFSRTIDSDLYPPFKKGVPTQ